MTSKKKTEQIRKEVLNWIWWEEDHDDSEPLLWAVAEKIVDLAAERDKWRKIADDFAAEHRKKYGLDGAWDKVNVAYDSAVRDEG